MTKVDGIKQTHVYVFVCACVCICESVSICVCVYACACVCVWGHSLSSVVGFHSVLPGPQRRLGQTSSVVL